MNKNNALRNARVQRHWTQNTLATQLNTTRMTVMRWEQGTTLPGLYFREQLCQVFEMTEQELGLDQLSLEEQKPSPIWLVPEERNLFFTGREAVLQQLHRAFCGDLGRGVTVHAPVSQTESRGANGRTHGDAPTPIFPERMDAAPCHVQIISGLAGIGKTQAVLEYAYRYRAHYAAVIWLDAETLEIVQTDLMRVATALRLPAIHEQDENQVMQALRTWLKSTNNWLLILNNVEELALVYKLFSLPDPKGHVLITTRMQATGRIGHQLTLTEMNKYEGALLLLRRAKLLPLQLDLAEAPVTLREEAMELCQELGGLPLALDQAGSYIEETGCNVSGYLQRFRQRCSALLAWRGHNPSGYPFSMTATIQLARERVERQSPLAFELLCLCAFIHPSGIPEQLIILGAHHLGGLIQEAVADLLSLDEAFALLNATSLLRRDPETHLLTMHRLVQVVLRDQLAEHLQRLWVERMLQTLQSLFPASSYHEMAVWPLCEQILPHILSCLAHIERLTWGAEHDSVISSGTTLLLHAANYLLERARYQEAELLLKRALALSSQTNGPAYPGDTTTLDTLALLYERLGRYSKTEAVVQQVLFILRRRLLESNLHKRVC